MEQDNKLVVDKIIPVGFRVLVDVWKKPTTTDAGFVLPENENQGMPVLARISILGKKTLWQKIQMCLGLKPRYKVGQWVYFRKYSIDEMKLNTPEGEMTIYILEEPEIIGLVN